MKKICSLLIFAVGLVSSGLVMADASGHCNYSHSSAYSDEPFKICQMPASPADCEDLGNAEGNAEAVYGDGECPAENAVGTCDTGESKLIYFNGEADGLEIGCGFQSGEWINAAEG